MAQYFINHNYHIAPAPGAGTIQGLEPPILTVVSYVTENTVYAGQKLKNAPPLVINLSVESEAKVRGDYKRLEVPVIVRGVLGLADNVGRTRAGEEVVILVGIW